MNNLVFSPPVLIATICFLPCYSGERTAGESVALGACARTLAGITLLPVTVVKTRFEVCSSQVFWVNCTAEEAHRGCQ